MILFSKSNIELEYHAELNILEVRWIGTLEEHELTLMIRQVVKVVQQYAIKNILLDASHVDALHTASIYDSQVQNYFQQQLPIPTVKKIARVSAGYIPYDQRFISLYATLVKENLFSFEFQNFTYHYEALHWLADNQF